MREIGKVIGNYKPKIHFYFLKKGFRGEELEDIVQETILTIIESIYNFNEKSSLSTWIYSICQNLYRSSVYKAVRREKLYRRLESNPEKCYFPKITIDIQLAVEKLSTKEKELFQLYYIESRKIIEISTLLNIPDGTIKYKLHCIRKKLKKGLE